MEILVQLALKNVENTEKVFDNMRRRLST